MSDIKRKNVLIAWSGGVDSTALVARAVELGHRVHVVSLSCGQPHTQQKAEAEARRRLRPKLEAMAPSGHTNITTVLSYLEVNTGQTKAPMTQFTGWFYHLTSLMQTDQDGKYNFDEVHIGYVMGDDAASSATHMAYAWDHFCRALHGNDIDPPKLMFPLLRQRKGHVMRYLRACGLLDDVHVCELPQLYDDGWRACAQCPACHRHAGALANVEMHENARWLGNLLHDYDHTSDAKAARGELTNTLDEIDEEVKQTPQYDVHPGEPVDPAGGRPSEGDVGMEGSGPLEPGGQEPEPAHGAQPPESESMATVLAARAQHPDQPEGALCAGDCRGVETA
jgi:7-cyano-7-deazaguanine synthase in queuosine biosynthesis